MKIIKHIIQIHNCDNKKLPHRPEIKEENFKSLRNTLQRARELTIIYHNNAYIDWGKNYRNHYLINKGSLILDKYEGR